MLGRATCTTVMSTMSMNCARQSKPNAVQRRDVSGCAACRVLMEAP